MVKLQNLRGRSSGSLMQSLASGNSGAHPRGVVTCHNFRVLLAGTTAIRTYPAAGPESHRFPVSLHVGTLTLSHFISFMLLTAPVSAG